MACKAQRQLVDSGCVIGAGRQQRSTVFGQPLKVLQQSLQIIMGKGVQFASQIMQRGGGGAVSHQSRQVLRKFSPAPKPSSPIVKCGCANPAKRAGKSLPARNT